MEKNGPYDFFALHESIRKEYNGNNEVVVKTAEISFSGEIDLDLGGQRVRIMQTEAPHTDDSTIIYACEDKTLFLGDATCNDFFTGRKDEHLRMAIKTSLKNVGENMDGDTHVWSIPLYALFRMTEYLYNEMGWRLVEKV